jgi:hypothetical protein
MIIDLQLVLAAVLLAVYTATPAICRTFRFRDAVHPSEPYGTPELVLANLEPYFLCHSKQFINLYLLFTR